MIGLGLGLGLTRGGAWSLQNLFTAGEVGGVIDLSPVYPHQQLFQDTAGLQPVTAPGQTVALAKMRPGSIEFAQASASLRPTYAVRPKGGRRNQLQYTEQFDNAVWSKESMSVAVDSTTAPDNLGTADKLVEAAANAYHAASQYIAVLPALTAYTISIYLKAAERTKVRLQTDASGGSANADFNLATGTVVGGSAGGKTITPVDDGWYRCSFSMTTDADGGAVGLKVLLATDVYGSSYLGDGASGIYAWGAQIEPGTLTPYQRVTTAFDVYEAGQPHYGALWFDGVDDGMVSGTVTPGTDKVQVFMGLKKNSDAAEGWPIHYGNIGSDGMFALVAPGGASDKLAIVSRGTVQAAAATTSATYAAPLSAAIVATSDIAGDRARMIVNGVQAVNTTADQGTGNFLSYPMYMGRRLGATFPFNGEIEGYLGVRFGPNLSDAQLAQIATTINAKTGAYA